MPIPEDLRLYGRTDILTAVAHHQPPIPLPAGAPAWNNNNRNRTVTRTITLHYTHGWWYRGWRTQNNAWLGTTFNIDLDGTLYQCLEMQVRTNHAPGTAPTNGFINYTSIGVEMARFGLFEAHGGNFRVADYNFPFRLDNSNTEWCDYSPESNHVGPRRFNLKKMPGGNTYQCTLANKRYYYLKAATFNDDRNAERPRYVLDVLFTEEQYLTLIRWCKVMCEMHRIPKKFIRHPENGRENPWIDFLVLTRNGQPQPIRDECGERVKAHQGIMGHMNLQSNRLDPGASLDYYRIKRGISDKWWYPVNLNDSERAMNYLDPARVNDYMEMTEHCDPRQLERYYQASENSDLGYFPIGENRIWHGGIHLPSGTNSRPVYAMANGIIVAARAFDGALVGPNRPTSTCFVLVKHFVHTRDSGDEIDYGANSAIVMYTLYMHLERQIAQQDAANNFIIDYDALPKWINHYLIDHPADTNLMNGEIIFPNYLVLLGEKIGSTGNYIVSARRHPTNGSLDIQYGNTLHLELFTTEDPSTFLQSPWIDVNNRIEDPSANNIVADLQTIDQYIQDAAHDGIDVIDIKNAAPGLRNFAIKNKSEWSIASKNELTQEAIVDGERRQIGQIITDQDWRENFAPFAFHPEMVARPGANANDIGPFFGQTHVWHLHPFTFLNWMNERIDRHERIMAEQDKPGTYDGQPNPIQSNIIIQNSYITGFQNLGGATPNQLPQRTTANANNYPEARYSDNTYETNVDRLADQAALANGPQTATRFHLHLLEALDMINDEPHGATIVEGYVSTANVQCSDSTLQPLHRNGRAMDLRPASGNAVADWYNLYTTAVHVRGRMEEYYQEQFEIALTTDPAPTGAAGPTRAQLDQNSAELLRRIQTAANATDAALTANPAVQHLNMMRLHFGFELSASPPATASLQRVDWLNDDESPLTDSLMPDMHVKLRATIRGIAAGATAHFFILSRLAMNDRPPDIRDATSLRNLYGNLTFNLDEIERHVSRPNSLDDYCQRIQEQITDVDDAGNATVISDWIVPARLQRGAGSLYAVCIIPSGSELIAGTRTTEHCVSTSIEAPLPKLVETAWATDPSGNSQVSEISISNHTAYLVIRTADLPAGCYARAEFRNQRSGVEMSESRVELLAGSSHKIIAWRMYDIGEYHCRVTIYKPGTNLTIVGGSGLRVV